MKEEQNNYSDSSLNFSPVLRWTHSLWSENHLSRVWLESRAWLKLCCLLSPNYWRGVLYMGYPVWADILSPRISLHQCFSPLMACCFPGADFSLEWEPFCSSLVTQMAFEICPIDPCFEGVPADVVGFIFSIFRSRSAKSLCRRRDNYKRFLPPICVQEILGLL